VKRLIFLLLLIPQICFAQMVVQNRDIKQPPECKLFVSSNTPIIKDIATNKTITINGNTAISTAQIKTGKYSIYFDGTGDYLSLADSNDWYMEGDYTFDTWFYFRDTAGFKTILTQFVSSSVYTYIQYSNKTFYIRHCISGGTIFYFDFYGYTIDIADNTWNHLALVISGTSVKVYLNGKATSMSATVSGNPVNMAAPLYIGYYGISPWFPYLGHMQDIRITKGKALWTSNFTPPRRSGAY
jgi:hypothetical protein